MNTPSVTVHVNRGAPETLEPAVATLETSESFDLILEGHDTPAHIHCRLDPALDDVASLAQSNYYVEPNARTPVPIDVDAAALEGPVAGALEVLTGYGSESVAIRIVVEPAPGRVEIDDSLSEPPERPPEPSSPPLLERIERASGTQPATFAVVALGAVAILVATVGAASIGGTAGVVGLAIVVLGVLAAVGSMIR